MYFDFEDHHPDTPSFTRPISTREGVLMSVILHLLAVITILIGPELPFVKHMEARRLEAIEEQRRIELERQRENAQFVFVQPQLDIPAPKPPPVAELSDIDRQARAVERAANPTNPLPFSRGNSPERIIEDPRQMQARREVAAQPQQDSSAEGNDASRNGMSLPEAPTATEPRSAENARPGTRGPAMGVIGDAIRNVQKYVNKETFGNLQGGGGQLDEKWIQFDTKGVEFGPWLRRFVAQVRRNWFVPYAAMTMRGHVVITFFVHKDGRITDLTVVKPSNLDAFNNSAFGALASSNPTYPLPPEYPDDRAFFTVTFYFNETPQ
jgi:TonB family protein